ncbi:DegT/DnrJ/EryC1/StrS family aminotransferase [Dickeya zeae]|uniref:DegT/DnrJ/EryC1/StrS family aminotransferase n=1 Tax=Dickeya zeae TaxID=204042 RepID=UPI001F217C16|nr:DegT/DnrJ/EryC1/StrS family aminotransferase [Dickeya zeae]UJR64370.1 DegT/DnrJ/EryC1/StrS aminotransferase family protein [Dickeya zeae]
MNEFMCYGEPPLGCSIDDGFVDRYVHQLSRVMKNKRFSANSLIDEFEQKFISTFNEENFSLITNATTALELALYVVKIESGFAHVVTQAIGFFGVHSMVLSRGYSLTLCDVQKTSFDFDYSELETKLLNGSNVILVTHMNGIPVNMKSVTEVAKRVSDRTKRKIWIIDDLSRSLGAKIESCNISSFSDFTVFSFQSKKHMTLLGEGGGIVCKDSSHVNFIKAARGFGNKETFGFNHKISFSQVLFGLNSLDFVQEQIDKRISMGLSRDRFISKTNLFDFLYPNGIDFTCTYYLYTLKINERYPSELRDTIINILKYKGIGCSIANLPVYKTSGFINSHLNFPICTNSDELGNRIFSVSMHPSFSDKDEEYVINSLCEIANAYN